MPYFDPVLLAAASVGLLHMSAPDHWVTLVVLGRVSKWSRARLMGVGLMAAAGHVAFSVGLGFAIVGLGFFLPTYEMELVARGIGVAMLVGGLAYAVYVLRKNEQEDYEKEVAEELAEGERKHGRRFGYFAVLGAALSPDLSILPIFLLAVPSGFGFTATAAVVFGIGSIFGLLFFLFLGSAGLAKAFEKVPPKYNDALVGAVIAAVGLYTTIFG